MLTKTKILSVLRDVIHQITWGELQAGDIIEHLDGNEELAQRVCMALDIEWISDE